LENKLKNAKYRFILILGLLIFLLTTISSASAADTIYVNNATGNDSWDGTSATYQGGIIGPKATIQNGTGTVDDGGTVNVADGTYLENLIIDKNVNLMGQSQTATIIDANNAGHGLDIYLNLIVTLTNFSIINGNSALGGGIVNSADLTLTRCTFTDNTAVIGGAIYNFQGTVTATDCTFNGNTATSTDFGEGGGAIYSIGTLNIADSTFTNNQARDGGAIYNYQGTCTVTGSTFTGNTATTVDGGAVESYAGTTLIVDNCVFTQNTANEGGGAIDNMGTGIVTNSQFIDNSATIGGAIYNNEEGSILTVYNCDFTANAATNTNYFGGAAIFNNGTCTVTDSNFTGNNATPSDGATIDSIGPLTVTGCTFTNNEGGAVANTGSTMIITGSTFTGNHALWNGGAIWNDNGLLTVTDSTFTGNTAGGDGGLLFNTGTVTMNFNRIVGNSDSQGYTIYNEDEYGVVDATDNWWGSNSPDFGALIYGEDVTYSPWLYLTFSALPATIPQGSTSTLTASFNQHTDGTTVTPIDPVNGHIPDGSPVTFTTTLGNVGSKFVEKYTVNGIATATLYADEGAGNALVGVTADNQNLNSTVTITPVVNAATTTTTKTVGMQSTGAPIVPLAFAVFCVLGGLMATRKKQ
jgi:hypothetical protein